ncbi:MAG: ribulose-phosphate 3-epimerase [Bacteroidetes bacterium]|nr:MAG: ribulose-phosphate 3-epimerase [Bacteroidota bacterium]
MPLVAPSLLAANFLKLEDECKMLNESQADWFHLDIMDGRFVPNISFGPMIVKFVRSTTKKYCDVHLMIVEPWKYFKMFKDAGANNLSIHIEACPDLLKNIEEIKSLGMDAGIAISPDTPIENLKDALPHINVVCMMSVYPGFGGQEFIPGTMDRIKQLRKMIDEKGLKVKIEIDGGVTEENAAAIAAAGTDVLVAGNTVFRSKDPVATIRHLKMEG